MISFIKEIIFGKSQKKFISFARTEPTEKAIKEKIDIFGSDMNKQIVFYITDGSKIYRRGKEPYTEAKEKYYKKFMIFADEIHKGEIPLKVKQELGSIKLIRE